MLLGGAPNKLWLATDQKELNWLPSAYEGMKAEGQLTVERAEEGAGENVMRAVEWLVGD